MTNIDQFESVFKAADKPAFRREVVNLSKALLITDMDPDPSAVCLKSLRIFLDPIEDGSSLEWQVIGNDQYADVRQLLDQVEAIQPDLICTYRNLQVVAHDYPYSLGDYVDVLTQVVEMPVLLLPHPNSTVGRELGSQRTENVMAITDHLAGDHHLVSCAATFVTSGGKLILAHVEDEQTFDRYISTISKIPSIDTDVARESIQGQLLKEPHDFIRSCRKVLETSERDIHVEEVIAMGHHLIDYKRLVQQHNVHLLVMNTKDEDQLAMHGLAYPLSVEMREIPLLLL